MPITNILEIMTTTDWLQTIMIIMLTLGAVRQAYRIDIFMYRMQHESSLNPLSSEWMHESPKAKEANEVPKTVKKREDDEWKTAAIRLGEELSGGIYPSQYYDFESKEWLSWSTDHARKLLAERNDLQQANIRMDVSHTNLKEALLIGEEKLQQSKQRAEAAEAELKEVKQRAEAAEAELKEVKQRAEAAEAELKEALLIGEEKLQQSKQRAEAAEAELARLHEIEDQLRVIEATFSKVKRKEE